MSVKPRRDACDVSRNVAGNKKVFYSLRQCQTTYRAMSQGKHTFLFPATSCDTSHRVACDVLCMWAPKNIRRGFTTTYPFDYYATGQLPLYRWSQFPSYITHPILFCWVLCMARNSMPTVCLLTGLMQHTVPLWTCTNKLLEHIVIMNMN